MVGVGQGGDEQQRRDGVLDLAAPPNVRNGSAGSVVQTVGSGGSELLIFVPRAAHSVTRES